MLNIASHLPHTHRSVLEICQALPGYLLANGQYTTARAVLLRLVDQAGGELIPSHAMRFKPPVDGATNLWFGHAAYAYFRASEDVETWRKTLLPVCKQIAQALISNGLGDTTMTDAGLLLRGPVQSECYPMAPNALWYAMLAMLDEELKRVGDRSARHFELLAGRFRRSFSNVFLCDRHGCLCEPQVRASAAHDKPNFVPDPDQLLFVVLPFSPLARTKQRTLVDRLKAASVSDVGLRVPWKLNVEAGDKGRVGRKPEIVSPLYLAWLAEALVKARNGAPDAIRQAQAWMASVVSFGDEHDGHLAWLYELRSQRPAGGQRVVHGPTVAEVLRVTRLVEGLANGLK
jgi:hypothetical protein